MGVNYAYDTSKQLIGIAATGVIAEANYNYMGLCVYKNVYTTVDPFGNLPLPMEDNYFGFSSEYYDRETRLVYYNYRYYSPQLGRWISRDPIGEEGGENLYIIVSNNVQSFIDFLGFLNLNEIERRYREMIIAARKEKNMLQQITLSIFLKTPEKKKY